LTTSEKHYYVERVGATIVYATSTPEAADVLDDYIEGFGY